MAGFTSTGPAAPLQPKPWAGSCRGYSCWWRCWGLGVSARSKVFIRRPPAKHPKRFMCCTVACTPASSFARRTFPGSLAGAQGVSARAIPGSGLGRQPGLPLCLDHAQCVAGAILVAGECAAYPRLHRSGDRRIRRDRQGNHCRATFPGRLCPLMCLHPEYLCFGPARPADSAPRRISPGRLFPGRWPLFTPQQLQQLDCPGAAHCRLSNRPAQMSPPGRPYV